MHNFLRGYVLTLTAAAAAYFLIECVGMVAVSTPVLVALLLGCIVAGGALGAFAAWMRATKKNELPRTGTIVDAAIAGALLGTLGAAFLPPWGSGALAVATQSTAVLSGMTAGATYVGDKLGGWDADAAREERERNEVNAAFERQKRLVEASREEDLRFWVAYQEKEEQEAEAARLRGKKSVPSPAASKGLVGALDDGTN